MGMIAAVWFDVNELGLVIALAMATVLVAAALGGILIPLLLTASASIRPSPPVRSSPQSPMWSAFSPSWGSLRSGSG